MHDLEALLQEGRRELEICNACRYCEAYCAVFHALERGPLTDGDIVFVANVCHDCRACLQACMYAPPHEFGVDLPQILADVRTLGYRKLVWPAQLGWTLEHPVATKVLAFALGLALAAGAAVFRGTEGLLSSHHGPGSFYRVISAEAMMTLFLALSALMLALLVGGFTRFWSVARQSRPVALKGRDVFRAFRDAVLLRNLGGGGDGCYYPDPERPSGSRRVHHMLVVGGMTSAFAATVVAAAEQHLLGRLPPYSFLSAPVLLGTAGGVAVIVGGAGLARLKYTDTRRRRLPTSARGYAFIGALEVVAVTGVLLLVFRSTAAMPMLLTVHLGAVAGLYLSLPFDHFVHAVHRLGALVLDAAEVRAESRDKREQSATLPVPIAPTAGAPTGGQRAG